ncbi:MAG: hypothetical protein WBN96_03825 [Gammaproteobacteria bacterium]
MVLAPLSLVAYNAAAFDRVDLGVGFEKTSGDYGTLNDTDITTIPFFAQYTENNWRFRLTIPYLRVTGDGSVIPGNNGVIKQTIDTLPGSGGGLPVPTTGIIETNSGLGDVVTSVSHAFPPKGSDMFYELTGTIKWGTASARNNLGTGQNDLSVKLYSMYEKYDLRPFATIGYLVVGDTKAVDYDNALFATAGLAYRFSPMTTLSVAYDYQQATSDSNDDGRMLGLYANHKFSREWSGNVYVLNGLSDSVADSGAGFTVIHSY